MSSCQPHAPAEMQCRSSRARRKSRGPWLARAGLAFGPVWPLFLSARGSHGSTPSSVGGTGRPSGTFWIGATMFQEFAVIKDKRDAPGLKCMRRHNGRVDLYWVADPRLVKQGYTPK